MQIADELLDKIAMGEVQALLEGLDDPEMRKNPAFLEKVRKFLAQNKLQTTPETDGVDKLRQHPTEEIPVFECEGMVM